MVETIFANLAGQFQAGVIKAPTTFYFSIDTVKRTVTLQPDGCRVSSGKSESPADCVCKMGTEIFLQVWNHGYRPGMKDFLNGTIKSNDPQRLKLFLDAFGKGR